MRASLSELRRSSVSRSCALRGCTVEVLKFLLCASPSLPPRSGTERSFALVATDAEGTLRGLVARPAPAEEAEGSVGEHALPDAAAVAVAVAEADAVEEEEAGGERERAAFAEEEEEEEEALRTGSFMEAACAMDADEEGCIFGLSLA